MRHGHLVWAMILAIGILIGSGIAVRSPVASRQDATPVVSEGTLTATVASVSFESYDGINRVSFAVYQPSDPASAGLLYETLSAPGQEPGQRRISFPPVGAESVAFVSASDLTPPDGPVVVVYARTGEFIFVFRTRGENPIELMEWTTGFLPFDPADELDDAGTDDITLLLPDLQDMPPGYVAISEEGTATPTAG